MKNLQLTFLLLMSISLYSCQKEITTESFQINLQIQNYVPGEDFGYPCGDYEEYCPSYPVQIWAAAYVGTSREHQDANEGVFRQGLDGSYHTCELEYMQSIHIQEVQDLEPGAQVMITISCWDKEESFWINSGDQVEVEINEAFAIDIKVSGNTGENPFAEPNSLFGKWVNLSACADLNGQHSYYEFSNNDKGFKFIADCSNHCLVGQHFSFEYIDNYSSVDLKYLNASNDCQNIQELPEAESINYQRSTNTLLIDGEEWTKQ